MTQAVFNRYNMQIESALISFYQSSQLNSLLPGGSSGRKSSVGNYCLEIHRTSIGDP